MLQKGRAFLRFGIGASHFTPAITDAVRAAAREWRRSRRCSSEEGKNRSFGGCIRRPTADRFGPTAPPVRKGLVRPERTTEK